MPLIDKEKKVQFSQVHSVNIYFQWFLIICYMQILLLSSYNFLSIYLTNPHPPFWIFFERPTMSVALGGGGLHVQGGEKSEVRCMAIQNITVCPSLTGIISSSHGWFLSLLSCRLLLKPSIQNLIVKVNNS